MVLLALLCACAAGANNDNSGLTFGVGGPQGSSATMTEGDTLLPMTSGDATDSGTGQNTGGPMSNDCIDEDGDGFGEDCSAGPDCNDDDPEVNPGADERCNEQDDNCDEEIDNGCDCTPDGVSGDCNAPFDLGSIDMGQTELGVVANVPQADAIDWYQVSFPLAAERPGVGMPRITFAINEGESFAFDVVEAPCAAAGGPCGEGGTDGVAVGLTDWTFVDDDAGCCAPPDDSLVAWPTTVYLRVYRTTPGASCQAYQLEVSR